VFRIDWVNSEEAGFLSRHQWQSDRRQASYE